MKVAHPIDSARAGANGSQNFFFLFRRKSPPAAPQACCSSAFLADGSDKVVTDRQPTADCFLRVSLLEQFGDLLFEFGFLLRGAPVKDQRIETHTYLKSVRIRVANQSANAVRRLASFEKYEQVARFDFCFHDLLHGLPSA